MASIKAHTWSALLAKRKEVDSKLISLRKASSGMMAAVARILLPHSTVDDTEKGSLQVCSVPIQEKRLSQNCVRSQLCHTSQSSVLRVGYRERAYSYGVQTVNKPRSIRGSYFFSFWSSL